MTKRFVEACTSAEIDHFLDDQVAYKRYGGVQQRHGVNSGAEPAEASGEVSSSRSKRNGMRREQFGPPMVPSP